MNQIKSTAYTASDLTSSRLKLNETKTVFKGHSTAIIKNVFKLTISRKEINKQLDTDAKEDIREGKIYKIYILPIITD